jgi:hypothetical protein
MANHQFLENVSRRNMLQVIAGSAGSVVGVPLLHGAGTGTSHTHGLIQIADRTAPYSPKSFTAPQMELLAELTEIIIPTDEHSPGAKAADAQEDIDAIVADASPDDKHLWTKGLLAVDELAKRDCDKAFLLMHARPAARDDGKDQQERTAPPDTRGPFFSRPSRMRQ